jgi:hypothetical protein
VNEPLVSSLHYVASVAKKLSLNLISFVFGLSCLVAGEAFSASRVADICEGLLKARPYTHQDLNSQINIDDGGQPTVQIESSRPGIHPGGRLNILRRVGAKWNSTFSINAAVQGDPRTAGLLAGSELSHYLGFSVFDEEHIQAPNGVELNGRLSSLNKILVAAGHEPVSVRFLDMAGIVDDYKFIQLFNKDLTMPLAVEGAIHIHDVSYHAVAFTLPPSVVEAVRKVTIMQSRFADFLKTRLNQVEEQKNREFYMWLVGYIYQRESIFIDTVLGNTVVSAANVADIKRYAPISRANEKLSILTEEFGEIQGLLYDEYFNFFGQIKNPTLRTTFASRRQRLLSEVALIDEQELIEKAFKDFIEQNPDISWDVSLGNFDPEHVLYLIDQRIADMQKALAEASK